MSGLNFIIRREEERDYGDVFNIIERAFKGVDQSDHREQFLVEKLRKSSAFIPELSLVACSRGSVVGHILFTKIHVSGHELLALAPLSVSPDYQGMGVGGALIRQGHKAAAALGDRGAGVMGHEGYYPKFGYGPAVRYKIFPPFECPAENFMCIELVEDGLKGIEGVVEYAPEFGITG